MNTPGTAPISTIQERFKTALSELIGMCMEGGMHTSEMIEPMEKELRWLRETSAFASIKRRDNNLEQDQ